MKKLIITLLLFFMFITGCIKRDNMEDITIYTTIYPINYIINYLYGDNAKIKSIYPIGADINTYELTQKQLESYSSAELFIFDSLDVDRNYAVKLINMNKKLKIIDVALGMEIDNNIEELWLNPYNYLMLAQNVKNGLKEYITNPYLIKEINDNYDDLKIKLSELDAEIKQTVKSANYNTIIVDNNLFKYLEKYNLNVISLEETENLTKKDIEDAKKLISTGKVKYIYTKDKEINNTIKDLLTNNKNLEQLNINTMRSIDGGVQTSNDNYITIMKDNLDLIKRELYK